MRDCLLAVCRAVVGPKFPWVWYSVLGFVGFGAASALSFGAKSMSLCSHVLRSI